MIAEKNATEATDNSYLEQRVKAALQKYVRETKLRDVKYSVTKGEDYDFTMYATYYFVEETMEINDVEIVVDQVLKNDSRLEIRICHELGHLDNALQFKKKHHIDPCTFLQKLYVEVMADRKAAKIYNESEGKRAVSNWLRHEIRMCVKYFKKHRNIETVRLLGKPFIQVALRYICNAAAQRKSVV